MGIYPLPIPLLGIPFFYSLKKYSILFIFFILSILISVLWYLTVVLILFIVVKYRDNVND